MYIQYDFWINDKMWMYVLCVSKYDTGLQVFWKNGEDS